MKQEELNQKYQRGLTLKMSKCVYCGKEYDHHKGLTLVMKDGKINHLCSAKCRKNMKMKRRKIRWVTKKKKDKKISTTSSQVPK